MTSIRVVLVEDHVIVRAGIRALLRTMDDIEVVAEASDGREAVRVIEQHQPDVVLMDIAMPGLNGLEALRTLHHLPKVRVLMLSMHTNEEYVWQALRAGAAGYLHKESDPVELELAIRAAARGETFLSPTIAKSFVEHSINQVRQVSTPTERLTARQREILQLVAEGHTTKEIAHILSIGVKTVETHRAQLMDLLDIHDVAGLVRFAIRTGLVSPE
jgi:DNA-binding NarL/FixJ family response regulator